MAVHLLQLPGLAELVVGFAVLLVTLAMVVGVSYWVYTDAKRRGTENAGLWAAITAVGFLAGLFPGIAVVVVYLLVRD